MTGLAPLAPKLKNLTSARQPARSWSRWNSCHRKCCLRRAFCAPGTCCECGLEYECGLVRLRLQSAPHRAVMLGGAVPFSAWVCYAPCQYLAVI